MLIVACRRKMLLAMVNVDSEDTQSLMQRGTPSKAQTHLCALCRSSLLDIESEMEATYPIKLAMLDFQVFLRYLATFRKTSMVTKMVLRMEMLSWTMKISTSVLARLHSIVHAPP